MLKFLLFLFLGCVSANYNIGFEKINSKFEEYRFSTSFNSKYILNHYKNISSCQNSCKNNNNCLGYISYPWKYVNNNCQTLNNIGIIINTERTSYFTNMIKYIEYNNTNYTNYIKDTKDYNIIYFKNYTNRYLINKNNTIIINKNINNISFNNNTYIYFYNNCSIIFYFRYGITKELKIDSFKSKVNAKIYTSIDNIDYNYLGTLDNYNNVFNLSDKKINFIKMDFYYKNNRFRKYRIIKNLNYHTFNKKLNETSFINSNNITSYKKKMNNTTNNTLINTTNNTMINTTNNTLINTTNNTTNNTMINRLNNTMINITNNTMNNTLINRLNNTMNNTLNNTTNNTLNNTMNNTTNNTLINRLNNTMINRLINTMNNTSDNKNYGSEILDFIEDNLEKIILIALVILLFILLTCILRKYFINIRRGIKRSQEDIERLSTEIKKRKIDNRTVVNENYATSFENNDYLYDTLANTIIEDVEGEREDNETGGYINIDYDKDNSSSV